MIRAAAFGALLLLAATPATAASYVITAFGQLVGPPPLPNQIAGLPFANGNAVFGSWRVDLDPGTGVDLPPFGGTGAARLYAGNVRNGVVAVSTSSGMVVLSQTAASLGAILVINDSSLVRPSLPTLRTDQVNISDGLRFGPGPILGYAASGLASDVIVRSLGFGKVQTTTNPVLPGLVTSADLPDLGTFFATGNYFFSFTLTQGNPQTAGQVGGLPATTFSVVLPQVFVTQVPEPATWALLIVGFGLVGTALRRAATPAPGI
ncbi:PEPxxWA-CTERM sorting domain-containing protein [Glacieibacterium frigidum]|uniref:PEP-CTERM sorting domain-containing protein n=1 Tax=Glacieibacterium frigidum TaxID=2593303 RepID=A0A552U917_9SPHN|nr:PEPxxWA-CTERM sorting domain-containing protein [Glacieibacterium frigidum]TRW14703.1 PEP-CTERM sorting domain-containing protein [Glacieibacterium frigidum]